MFSDAGSNFLHCREETLTDETFQEESLEEALRFQRQRRAPPLPTSISISERRGRFIITVQLGKGRPLHFGQTIPIAIGIDENTIIRRKAQWNTRSRMATIGCAACPIFVPDGLSPRDQLAGGRRLAISLLDQLAAGSRVAIRVGNERGHIILDGSAAAIDNFRARIGE